MYCPKCKTKYTDGSLRCSKCNQKLIVKLPMKKVKKKRQYNYYNPINLEQNKRRNIFEVLFEIVVYRILYKRFIFTFIGGFLLYFAGIVAAFEIMHLKDAILLVDILNKFYLLLFLIVISIILGCTIEDWKYCKKLGIKNKIITAILKSILSLLIVTSGINMLSKPVFDFVYKDYHISLGTVNSIKKEKYGYCIYVDHKYHSYNRRLKHVTIGQTYTFTYSKRSDLILDIK
ncbi:hypothetical protein [Clostridium ganghwense]|uniref:Zinc ribbon domain-containing protein n=1 Tax=Clostridium ganghwense TaxID=312089 RepID=A0ABT4CU88_9CLOT|nr:hypothetical protein [Clostridium ganghwense]MCY6372607.1 hypothetical protein [Clostridium ganghwense]